MPLRCEVRWSCCLAVALLCLSGVSSELRILSLRTVLKKVVSEALQELCPPVEQTPGWRSSCPSGFTPCGGRCYARQNHAVEYSQAEKDCAAIGAHLAVPRSRDQNLCVAGLAGYEGIWLGVTDRQQEGMFQGADGRPVTANGGQVWGRAQPDNYLGREDCVEIKKVRDLKFTEWNDAMCSGYHNYPMCQLK